MDLLLNEYTHFDVGTLFLLQAALLLQSFQHWILNIIDLLIFELQNDLPEILNECPVVHHRQNSTLKTSQ